MGFLHRERTVTKTCPQSSLNISKLPMSFLHSGDIIQSQSDDRDGCWQVGSQQHGTLDKGMIHVPSWKEQDGSGFQGAKPPCTTKRVQIFHFCNFLFNIFWTTADRGQLKPQRAKPWHAGTVVVRVLERESRQGWGRGIGMVAVQRM